MLYTDLPTSLADLDESISINHSSAILAKIYGNGENCGSSVTLLLFLKALCAKVTKQPRCKAN